ncbi:MAG: RsiV family protein [Hyphomonadaceae bacterium JAD_PAG50586_4]|nr:MAG: RsiV family protein [Hyphomonadaceae bacterium JAD_PAG50586_4]
MRGVRFAGASIALLALVACGDRGGEGKTDQSSAERISAALDVCAEGRGEFAQHVCENQTLAGLDTNVRDAIVAASANVSDAGAQMLVQNQNRWRDAQRIACGIVDPEAAPTAEQQTCLESEYRARLEDAQNAVQDIGGYTFQRMELLDATPVTAEVASASGLGDDAPPAVLRDIRFPRIDGQQTPAIQRFNELVAQSPQFRLEDATNEVVDYRIGYAGPELISVRFDMANDTLGAAHGNNTSKAVTVLMTEGRALAATDVFRAGTGWEQFLTQRAVAEISRQYREDGFVPPERDVQESVTKPHLWLITEQGLTLLFPPYSFGAPYVMGGTEVSIPWADLRQYLNPAAPAPIRPSA